MFGWDGHSQISWLASAAQIPGQLVRTGPVLAPGPGLLVRPLGCFLVKAIPTGPIKNGGGFAPRMSISGSSFPFVGNTREMELGPPPPP